MGVLSVCPSILIEFGNWLKTTANLSRVTLALSFIISEPESNRTVSFNLITKPLVSLEIIKFSDSGNTF
ncbi:MAG: hypothetical protein MZV64_26710 [Ignavibacteriales bacterium]|nr:hypothetical protein [Ignavibacteriales bacterium]